VASGQRTVHSTFHSTARLVAEAEAKVEAVTAKRAQEGQKAGCEPAAIYMRPHK
jgi:hypothetical protein